jgi:hypothetical protein
VENIEIKIDVERNNFNDAVNAGELFKYTGRASGKNESLVNFFPIVFSSNIVS